MAKQNSIIKMVVEQEKTKVTKEYSSIIRKQKIRGENENRKCKQLT